MNRAAVARRSYAHRQALGGSMELIPTTFVQIVGSTVTVSANSVAEAKLALKELKLKKKEYGLLKRSVNEREKGIRATYTEEVRTQGSMMRGGGGFGRFVRGIQAVSRDGKRSQLANALAPLEAEKQDIEAMLGAIDSAILQVEAHLLKHER